MASRRGRPTVLIADNHPVWRRGLRDVLATAFEVVAETNDGSEAVEKALACRPDVVVLDIALSGLDAISATRQIKEALPNTGVVMTAVAVDAQNIHAAIRVGVSAYVVKDDSAAALIQAVSDAVNRG